VRTPLAGTRAPRYTGRIGIRSAPALTRDDPMTTRLLVPTLFPGLFAPAATASGGEKPADRPVVAEADWP